jgi:hypothetical protein
VRHICDDIVYLNALPNRRTFLDRVPDVPNHFAGATHTRSDVDQNRAKHSDIHVASIDESFARVRIVRDPRKRLVYFVRYRRGHHAKQADSGQKIDLLALALRFFFGKPARRNIDESESDLNRPRLEIQCRPFYGQTLRLPGPPVVSLVPPETLREALHALSQILPERGPRLVSRLIRRASN